MLSYQLTEEQEMIRDMARSFAKKEILPVAEHYDSNEEYPWPIVKKAGKLGLISSNIPEAYGGPGMGVLEECIINEELAWGCSGIQTALMLNNLAAWPIILAGNEAQKQRYLPRLTTGGELASYGLTEPAAGSDVAGILTTAVKKGDEYYLNGTKTWITNAPVASFFVIFAKTEPEARHKGHERVHRRAQLARRQREQADQKDGTARGVDGRNRDGRRLRAARRTGWATTATGS